MTSDHIPMTPEESAEVARSDDGRQGWVTVRVVTDGGSLRLWPDGDLINEDDARGLVWEEADRG